MKIEGNRALHQTTSRRLEKRGQVSGGSFSNALEAQSASVGESASGATVAPIEALLAVQEVAEDGGGRRAQVKRGFDLLDELERLRNSLILGQMTPGMLARLNRLLHEERPQSPDPRLSEVLNEIEIRVAVELAKRERR